MEKNVAGKWIVFAYGSPSHASAGLPITGDAANITANIRIDGGISDPISDINPTELEGGYYVFDITASESNGDLLLLHPSSVTANVLVEGVPAAIYTSPPNFNDTSIQATGEISIQETEVRSAVGLASANIDNQFTNLDVKTDTIDANVDAIKAKSDQMVFTKANELDANTLSINSATVVGDGNLTPWDGA